MRKTVSKRIRKFCTLNGYSRAQYRVIKKSWSRMPWTQRFKAGQEME